MIRLFVGLGNPGKKYENTRHNVGFKVIDKLAELHNIKINLKGFQSEYFKGQILDKQVILLKPITYMNLSGVAVSSVVSMYKIPIENIFIIYDDMDLPVGKLRIRLKGSAGGHNGMKSIIESLGNNQDIPRLRIGIGRSQNDNQIDYVLSQFSKENEKIIDSTIMKACKSIEELIKTEDIIKVMNEYNADNGI